MAQQYALPRKTERIELKPPPKQAMPSQPPVPVPVVPAGGLPAAGKPTPGDPRGMTPVILALAAKYDITPEIALRVAKSEGLAQFYGDNGASGGAMQLYTKGGLGNEFQKATGLNPLDQKNEIASIDYALKHASQNGWGPWYGAAKVGIGQWDGIPGKRAPLDPTPNVGSGETGYKAPLVDPTPYVGSGASGYADTPDEEKKDEKKKRTTTEKIGDAAGEGLENVGKAYAAGAKNTLPSSPATVAPPMLPLPQGPQPMVDPKMVEMQRQQLAMAMRRLNSGKLV